MTAKKIGTDGNDSVIDLCKRIQLPNSVLNNPIEQDHRFTKRRVNAGIGFFSFNTARQILRGYESLNMIRKGQIAGIGSSIFQFYRKEEDDCVPSVSRRAFEKKVRMG
jgi:transposase-like protein